MKFIKKSQPDPHKEHKSRFHAWVDSLPEFETNPASLRFWRDSFLIFVVAGIVGHAADLLWRIMMDVPVETWIWQLLPVIAIPYGLAALATLWFVYPLFRAKKIGTFLTYLFGAIVVTAVEFLCGVTLMAMNNGVNPYWDYSHLPFNLFGQVCLQNSVVFGFVAIAGVCFILPWLLMRFNRLSKMTLNIITGALVACCIASIVLYFIFGLRLVI